MTTEKLYYTDAYIKDFYARVIEVTEQNGTFDVVLDRTAFFPEEGGQTSDKGTILGARVIDVREIEGVIHHYTDSALEIGADAECHVDFEERFEKMQCHTAEHILCGIIHRRFGLENVGFHLGDCEVVFDVDGVLDKEQLDSVEEEANRAVYENRAVTTAFPSAEELGSLAYRAKLDLTENVRIVTVDGYDSCACCAPHVGYTGEIGLISLVNFEKHRGGTRIYMLAGRRAERDYRERRHVAGRISALTSEPQKTIDCAVEKLINDYENLKQNLKNLKNREAELHAELLNAATRNAVVLIDGFGIPELIEFSNHAILKVGGILVALSGVDGDYKYVISSHTSDLRKEAKAINAALGGRGGGRPEMIQGSFSATFAEIEDYFK